MAAIATDLVRGSSDMQPIAPDLWHLASEIRLPGGARMPLASTLIRLPDRSLLLYSPIEIDDTRAAQIATLGEVAHIVAPNLFHNRFVAAAIQRFPRAALHLPPTFASRYPGLPPHRTLGADADAAWLDALDVEVIGGAPRINETVMFHRSSGTLVCADFVFHVTRAANLRTRIILAMMGAGGGKLAQSRAWRFLRRDRTAARASIDRILTWPIARVAPAHGEPVAIDSTALASRVTRAYGGAVTPLLHGPSLA